MAISALAGSSGTAVPIHLVDAAGWDACRAGLSPAAAAFAAAQDFKPKAGRHALLPDRDGRLAAVLFGLDVAGAREADPLLVGKLPGVLPPGSYRFASEPADPALATLAWLLGGYRFGRYRKPDEAVVRLVPPDGVDAAETLRVAEAVAWGRDLVNTPANDLGPDGIEAAARDLACRHGARIAVTTGDELLAANLPLIHAVGRAAAVSTERAPRLVDIAWGAENHPKVTLVGKGVAFDTGGLDVKPASGMLLMKKDMGGAAAALAAAAMVMGAGLPVRLRVLVPAVENAISAASFRPGDVLASRKGLSVEIGNTDAEGRLILADALALADEETPDLVVDFATLTGAARVALGPDLPPLYTADDALAADLARLGAAAADPVWRMPLWPRYERMLESKVADLNNAPSGGFAGSVTAALFLARFVAAAKAWAHLDIYGWNPATRPGRPEGGEVQGARLVYALLRERYPAIRQPD